ncbi:segregation and condensation protein B [Nonomuraea angiospora]|uniref:Segregation and condensation protein B n=1 Tax=Nonomuraea angiospora TaxID=46172 RepID=A0ABR9MJ12_9ACTN|nr:segregation and condensation protein B [Nonomuraea angiospora]
MWADEARSTGGAESADEAGSTADALLADEEVSVDGPLSQEADSAPAPDVPSAAPDAGPPGAGSAGRGAAEFGATRTADEAGASEAGGASAPEWREADAALGVAPGQGAEGFDEGQERAAEGPTLEAALEAILLVVDEPVSEITLAQVLERPTHEVVAALRGLAAEYTAAGRGFDLRDVAGGWRFYTRADCAPLVERFVRDGQQTRLTQAALETLAVVAYRQPVSRARVAAVRGVNSDGVMRTLVARGLVEEAGTDPESQAVLYRTSSYFLERLGLRDLSELPELAPFLPDDVENLEETTK